jgi:hypothetical protein
VVDEQGRESIPAAARADEQGTLHTWRVYGAKLLLASGLCHRKRKKGIPCPRSCLCCRSTSR